VKWRSPGARLTASATAVSWSAPVSHREKKVKTVAP
jgi:hypothetical protein